MKLSDFNKLKKFMQMTLSGSDAEKLMAMNKANELLRAENVDWDRVLNRMVHLEVELAPVDADDHAKVEELLSAAEEADPRGSWADFVASLREQFDRSGRLTPKQVAALEKGAR